MINKLERWAWIGGALLAANAGMVNAVGLKSYVHQAVTHVTGSTTLFTLAFAHHDLVAMSDLGMVLLSFVAGAALSGFIVQKDVLRLGRRYGVALLIESLLLMTAAFLMRSNNGIASYFASAACGLQNAMASTYSGAVLRTTHVSGMFTDLGAALGHWLRGLSVDGIRVRLYVTLVGSFMLGGVLGTLLFDIFSFNTLYIPAALTGGTAAGYALYAHMRRR
jgi:uncharacterized membrane protein YoaK (UPF0700 family)